MQPRLCIKVLVLQPERLMRVRVYLVLCSQFSPRVILPRPQQVAELVGLLPRNADLVGVVVGQVEFLVFVVVEDMRQGFVAVLVGVKVSVNAFVVVLLYDSRSVPDEDGAFGVGAVQAAFVDPFLADSAAEGVVGVLPLLYFAVGFVQFGADELVFGVVFEQLAFAVGQFAQGQVAQGVVMVLCPAISGNAVALRAVQAAFSGVSGQLVEDLDFRLSFGAHYCY